MPGQPPETSQPTGAEEFVLARIRVENLGAPTAQAEVMAAVEALAGIRTATIVKDELHVVYDPLRTTEREIEGAVAGSGHQPQGGEAERDSPFAESKE